TATALHRGIEPGMAHVIHLDAYVAGEMGGTGVTAAWDVASALSEEMPIMLAGGLTPVNVAEAVVTVRPWAVDVSSGVERDGVKDVVLIESFIQAARGAAVGTGTNGG
ncbi:MAG: phosphoribosylanthranilate isomerase, partial [Dehalococcoidia bacterium]